jgi:hypothetical protein
VTCRFPWVAAGGHLVRTPAGPVRARVAVGTAVVAVPGTGCRLRPSAGGRPRPACSPSTGSSWTRQRSSGHGPGGVRRPRTARRRAVSASDRGEREQRRQAGRRQGARRTSATEHQCDLPQREVGAVVPCDRQHLVGQRQTPPTPGAGLLPPRPRPATIHIRRRNCRTDRPGNTGTYSSRSALITRSTPRSTILIARVTGQALVRQRQVVTLARHG